MRRTSHQSVSRRQAGYTLLEVLVATLIMAIAVVGLLSNLSTSLQNAARLTDYDRARLIAKRTMDELLTRDDLPKMTDIQGQWDPRIVGVEGGWTARVTPFQRPPDAGPGQLGLDRIQVEVWWTPGGGDRRTFALEAYRASRLTGDDMAFAPMVP